MVWNVRASGGDPILVRLPERTLRQGLDVLAGFCATSRSWLCSILTSQGTQGWNLVSCNLSQAGTGAWHTVSAYSVSTHSNCVLAGIFSFFLPSASPKPGYPPCCPCHHLVPTPCRVWSGPTASPGGQPEPLACSACTAPLHPDCLRGPHYPCLFPVLDLGSPACPSRPGCFSKPPLDLSEPSSQVSPPGYPSHPVGSAAA